MKINKKLNLKNQNCNLFAAPRARFSAFKLYHKKEVRKFRTSQPAVFAIPSYDAMA